jgi:hypothetical protein
VVAFLQHRVPNEVALAVCVSGCASRRSVSGDQIAAIGSQRASATRVLRLVSRDYSIDKTISGSYVIAQFSERGDLLAAVALEGGTFQLSLFDLPALNPKRKLSIPTFPSAKRVYSVVDVQDLAFSADGRHVLLAGWAAPDRLGVLKYPWRAWLTIDGEHWNGAVDEYTHAVDFPGDVPQRIHLRGADTEMVFAGLYEIHLVRLDTAERITIGRHHSGIAGLAVSSKDDQVVAFGADSKISVFTKLAGDWQTSSLGLSGSGGCLLGTFVGDSAIALVERRGAAFMTIEVATLFGR